jgi:predicted transglutaminase-like cysteine proteinase
LQRRSQSDRRIFSVFVSNGKLSVEAKTMHQKISIAIISATLLVSGTLLYSAGGSLHQLSEFNAEELASLDTHKVVPIKPLVPLQKLSEETRPISINTPSAVPVKPRAHSPELVLEAIRTNNDMMGSAPIEFLAFSRELDLAIPRVSFDMPIDSSEGLLALAHEFPKFNAKMERAKFEVAAKVPVALTSPPVHRQASANRIDLKTTSPVHTALYDLSSKLDDSVDRVNFATPTLAPMAFVRFCMRYTQDCAVHEIANYPGPLELTKARMAELQKVNRDVNRAIQPRENSDGVLAEQWLVAPHYGDCHDYAVTKRHKLLALGWPSRSLLLAEVVVPSGEHHLILVVRTREEDLVLDNLNWKVRPISQIDYQWVRAQQPKNPRFWSMISVTRGTRVAMNGG